MTKGSGWKGIYFRVLFLMAEERIALFPSSIKAQWQPREMNFKGSD